MGVPAPGPARRGARADRQRATLLGALLLAAAARQDPPHHLHLRHSPRPLLPTAHARRSARRPCYESRGPGVLCDARCRQLCACSAGPGT
eukprot:1780072-Rhodomonas_salina.2